MLKIANFVLLPRFIVFIIFPAIACVAYACKIFLFDPLPSDSDGLFLLKNTEKNISIRRDAMGVTYLKADSDIDVYFAMGYAHAQDRLWQLEIQRRTCQGTLAEVLGRSALEQDIWIRTLGIYEAASKSVDYLSPSAIASLEAYAAGINEWIHTNQRLPIEFAILGIEPQPWKKEDSLAWIKVFALTLSGNYREEIKRFVSLRYLSDRQFNTLFEDNLPRDLVDRDANPPAFDGLSALFSSGKMFGSTSVAENFYPGSNAWVVSGSLTKSGAPILANDPHLDLQIPSLWYAVSQKGATLNASGMSLVGLPVIIFGRNQHIAWGGTAMMADVQDLYLEQTAPEDPNKYLYDGEFESFSTRTEFINVRADFPSSLRSPLKPVSILVRNSVHGPVISDTVTSLDQPVTLQWTGLSDQDTSYESFYRLGYAADWNEFKQALEFHIAPPLNILYADKRNNIGLIGVGRIPVRRAGYGLVPVSGKDKSYEWESYIPFDRMPQVFNPESGFLVNANNRNVDADYPYFISSNYAPPQRAKRITHLVQKTVQSGDKLTTEDMKRIQGDVLDLSVVSLLNVVRDIGPLDTDPFMVETLRKWDGKASMNSVGATIYYGLLRNLKTNLFTDELSSYWNRKDHSPYLESVIASISSDKVAEIIRSNEKWCDDVTTEVTESCRSMIESAFNAVSEEMTKLYGSDIDEWTWGRANKAVYQHVPFSQVRMLSRLFERSVSSAGSSNTVNVAGTIFNRSEGYSQVFGAGFRQIIEMKDHSPVHLFVNSTGQSGQVMSPHYSDMTEYFSDFHYLNFDPTWFSPGTSELANASTGNLQ